jgi:hypothetical protein
MRNAISLSHYILTPILTCVNTVDATAALPARTETIAATPPPTYPQIPSKYRSLIFAISILIFPHSFPYW